MAMVTYILVSAIQRGLGGGFDPKVSLCLTRARMELTMLEGVGRDVLRVHPHRLRRYLLRQDRYAVRHGCRYLAHNATLRNFPPRRTALRSSLPS